MKTKKKNPITAITKFVIQCVTALIFIVAFAIFMVASDMAEHPDLSGYEPETSTVEIAADILAAIF